MFVVLEMVEKVETYSKDHINVCVCVMCSLLMD